MRSPILRLGAATLLAASLAGCSDGGDASDLGPRASTGTVTLATADDIASRIEGVIYANALRGIGTPVEVRLGIGPGDAAVAAVERGEVTVAPALTGALWDRYRPGVPQPAAEKKETKDAKAQWDAQFVAVSAVLPEGLGLGDPTLALDQPMLYTRTGGEPASLRDCEGLAGPVAVPRGSPADIAGRYGCAVGPVTVVDDDAAAAREVTDGRAGLAQLGTLSAAAQKLNQVADPDGAVPSRAVVPLFRRDGLTSQQNKRLSAIAGELTTIDLAAMVEKVRSGEKTVDEVTGQWAADHPLH
ncbi:Substrate-binding region of ABC-type glycine betaine transport system OS=Tsukamurella paurometabola(strain ATCC 8368 / DSM / CCUG 35730 / CIP 100753 /JCM 10117 / KCTC 9821 / NBRC 16120 / NCIMB 702349 / NCTC 13040)OX=521096 GN=Tpau_1208 PE=4 SV=1 [Tsukamurella paurometabola]|uniref:Substrate-binding region of ABC-type glycine betaine transport system n=1 Tax=Tsukamurella paurometabola (strain ATCC 8368 / DSM 20162 / CCUG 35730 / CIP 100753 / JCM 10117 / KCTC 9821 / NBRC 16120 / NCIMB 702349 / NCTC 13040) TaxID=521096 RepID=D5UW32_TSUPD|nr:glycine/betaine ABC transporter substrate-binding protein [Tsukamurella paurometabola]ADG77839.1 Substrate-binding region of ABC-type glycine betaine transport system [Tsukamurella paurometabola DSM 20162]SUP28963.1 Substrate binding domain of ABC-type glycine betaine transport system [Tsukamurella paurometabola]